MKRIPNEDEHYDLEELAEIYNQDEKNDGITHFHKIEDDKWIKIDWVDQSAGDLLSNDKVAEELDIYFEEKEEQNDRHSS